MFVSRVLVYATICFCLFFIDKYLFFVIRFNVAEGVQADESQLSFEEDQMPSESLIETVGERVVDDVMNWFPSEFELRGAIERMKRHHCKYHPEKCAYHRQKIVDKVLRKINYLGQKYGAGTYGGGVYNDGLVTGHYNPHHHNAGHHKQGVQQNYDTLGGAAAMAIAQKQIPIEYQREYSKETFHDQDLKDYGMYPAAVPVVQLPHQVQYPTGHHHNHHKEFHIGFRKEH